MRNFEAFEKVACELLEFRVRRILSDHQMLVANFDAHSWIDMNAHGMVLELKARATARKRVEETGRVKIPDGWWQAFKLEWFPAWLARRFPVRFKWIMTTTIVYHCCPHLNVNVQGPHIEFLRQVDREPTN